MLTGGSGFVGKNLREQLESLYVLSFPTSRELNLLDEAQTAAYFSSHHFDVVIHAAGTGINRAQKDQPGIFENNTKMFLNLVANRSLFDRLISLGSGAEYDKSRPLVRVKESEFGQSRPNDEYGRAKYFISEQIKKYPRMACLRCFGVFGKYEDYATRFISNAICRSLGGLPIVMGQNRVFDYLYINDLIKIIYLFIDKPPEEKFINMGRGDGVELLTLAKIIQAATGNRSEIQIKNPGLGREYTCDNSLLMNELPGFAFTTFEQAINEMVAWYKENWHIIDQSKLNFDV